MRNFNLIISGVVVISTIVGIGAASAADLPARTYTKAPPPVIAPVYNWSGFYVGINGGGGSSGKCWNLVEFIESGVFDPPLPESCHKATGGTAGGQFGYRWQVTNWVFGVEAQGNWADFKGSAADQALKFSDHSKMNAFGLLTGQVGYAVNNVLFYAKGGAAVVKDKYFTIVNGTSNLIADAANQTRWGGVAGAGVEFAFASSWSIAFEYDHIFMGTKDVTFYSVDGFTAPPGAFSSIHRISQDVDVGTVRLNYRFGGPVVAKY
jgi:outer membrane immunogenic protein